MSNAKKSIAGRLARRSVLATAAVAAGTLASAFPALAQASTTGHASATSAVSITGSADIAYQDFAGGLETVTPDGVVHDSGLGMAGGTSPSVGYFGIGRSYQTYFQSAPGKLGQLSGFGGKDLLGKKHITIDQNTSPSSYQGAVALVTGSKATSFSNAAFTPNFPNLRPSPVAPGSSPSLSFFPESVPRRDHEAVAWENPEDNLDYAITAGVGKSAVTKETNTNLHMMPGTSPAIAVRSDGLYEVAFEGNDSMLWIVDSQGVAHNTQYGMEGDTSPSVTVVNTLGFEVAFQANTHALWTVNGESFLGQAVPGALVKGGTSPSINAYHPTF